MKIDAKLVMELRQKTGAGMMDCKKALLESNGSLENAIDHLRKTGITKAEKKGTRQTKEGNEDPKIISTAIKYEKISYDKVLTDNLRVMDLTAITLCKENNIPIQVFDILKLGNLKQLILGAKIGTLVSE